MDEMVVVLAGREMKTRQLNARTPHVHTAIAEEIEMHDDCLSHVRFLANGYAFFVTIN